jgi:V8-like Glu-specific endopeptidase
MESVIGDDQRTQIIDTTIYPWRAIAALLIVARDNSNWVGSAWFISARTLATAGHCVFINSPQLPARHGWVKSISVMPGRNGTTLPFGAATSTEFKSVDGWTSAGDPNHDYGAIILPSPLGTQVGTFGFGIFPDDDLKTVDANISGYPADKDPGTQWFDHRQVIEVNPTKVFYDIDTAGGQSGAPVWRVNGQETTTIAIHAYGVGGGIQSNSGTRITQEVYDNLKSWMQ